jgi:hypothetical protein
MRLVTFLAAFLISIVAIGLLEGCAALTHLTRTRNFPTGIDSAAPGKAVIVDAKQRLIVTSPIQTTRLGPDGKASAERFRGFCAEPSPDALSALAAGYGISLSKKDKLSLASSLSIAEGAGSIGLRTQSIQLMRDSMYRLCEGYLSGAIDSLAFQTLHRRFQSSMVAILAIEQLTGALRGPGITLGGSASVGKAELAAKLTSDTEAARNSVAEAKKTVVAADSVAKAEAKKVAELESKLAAEPDAAKKALIQADLDKAKVGSSKAIDDLAVAQKTESERSAYLGWVDAARQQALVGGGSAAMTTTIEFPQNAVPAGSIKEVADNITEIVAKTLGLKWGPEVCASILLTPAFVNVAPAGGVAKTCNEFLQQSVEAAKLNLVAMQAVAGAVKNLTPQQMIAPEGLSLIKSYENLQEGLADSLASFEPSPFSTTGAQKPRPQ